MLVAGRRKDQGDFEMGVDLLFGSPVVQRFPERKMEDLSTT